MLNKVASSTIFWVFGMTWSGIEPQSPGQLTNTLLIRPMENNSLLVTLFLNESELICLHTVKWSQVLLPNTYSFVWTQLNGFKYCYLTLVILFIKYSNCHVMAHGDEEVRLILSSRIEWEYQAVKKWPLGRNVGHTGDQMFALKWPQVTGHQKGKEREAKWLAGTPKRKWGSLPLSRSK